MNMIIKPIATLACTGLLLSACATNDPHQRAKIGAATGAVLGAVIGNQAGGTKTRVGGAVAGAAAGAAIGNYMDKQQAEMEQTLAAEQQKKEIELVRVKDDTIKLNLNSEVSFATNSADLNPGFYTSLDKVANVISEYQQTTVRVIGHTDSRGSDQHNQKLSEKRAESVSSYLALRGVEFGRITIEGRGEADPRAGNDSDLGRQQNRRVEILLKSTQPG